MSRLPSMCALWRTDSCDCKQDCSPGFSTDTLGFIQVCKTHTQGKSPEHWKPNDLG